MAHLWLSAFALDRRYFAQAASDDPRVNAAGGGQIPITYSISPNKTQINETDNRTVTYTVVTEGIDNGTTLYWINDPVEGVDSASDPSDTTPNLTNGTVTVNGGTYENQWRATGTITLTANEDFTTEAAQEEIRLRLKTGSSSGPTVATAAQVYINDSSKNPYINVSASPTVVQEPGAVTFSISSYGIPQGRVVSWTNTGTTTAADFTQNITSGTATIDANGNATVTLNVKDENVIEANETIVFNASVQDVFDTTRTASTTVTVTNAGPTYSVTPSTTSVNEGDAVTFTINTTNVANGTTLYWVNDGTTKAHDFEENATQGTVTINNNTASVTLNTRFNQVEANETIIFRIKTVSYTAGTVATASTVTVVNRDWSVSQNKITMNEGDSVTFTVTSPAGVPNGTPVYWDFSIDGLHDVAASDFFEGSNGSGLLVNESVNITLNAKFNGTEASQYLTMRFYEDSNRSIKIAEANTVTVRNSTFAIEPSASSINEGQSVDFTITTTNITNGTVLNWSNIGTATAADFVGNINSGTVTINSNSGTITLSAKNDLTTEGSENIKIELKPSTAENVVLATSSAVTINDTSLTPPTYDTLTVDKTSVNEGGTVTYTLNTSNVPNGTTLYWTNSGTSTAADFFPSGNSGSFTVNNNTATISLDVYNDTLTEGSQTIILKIRTGSINGTVVKTAPTVTINDTSLSPVWYAQYDACLGTGEQLTLSHGENAWPDVLEYEGICYSYTQDVNSAANGSLTSILFQGSQHLTCADCIAEHQPPTYSVTPDLLEVEEGSPVVFTITTENVLNGTFLYWSNSGTTISADMTGSVNSGTITINNNTATVTITPIADLTTEGNETIIFKLRTGSTSGTVVATASTVTVLDTSVDEGPPQPGGCYVYTFINEGGFEGGLQYTPCGGTKTRTLTLSPGQQGSTVCSEEIDPAVIPFDWSIISQDAC